MPVQANLLNRFGRVVRSYTFFYSESASASQADFLVSTEVTPSQMWTWTPGLYPVLALCSISS